MPTSSNYPSKRCYNLTATIASGDTTSGAVKLSGCTLVGLFIPSTFDGTTITFTASSTAGGTYVSVQQDNTTANSYTITTTNSRYVPISNLDIPAGLEFIKLVAGSSQTTSDTIITLVVMPS